MHRLIGDTHSGIHLGEMVSPVEGLYLPGWDPLLPSTYLPVILSHSRDGCQLPSGLKN